MIDFAAARRAMVDSQVRPSDVTRYSIIEALLWCPRELFVPKAKRDLAYADADIEIAPGRALLAPRTLAKMLEEADIGHHDLVLDLAPGTGYSTAVIARMAEAVVGVEPDPRLAGEAQKILSGLEVDNAVVMEGNPAQGDAQHGPYDVIFINGMVEQVPAELPGQLKDGGRLVALFPDGEFGHCQVWTRAHHGISRRYAFDAAGPLVPGFEKSPEFVF